MVGKKQKLEKLAAFTNKLYPNMLSIAAAAKYNEDKYKPYNILNNRIAISEKERTKIAPGKCVAHWFIRDFRTRDNHALSKANELATKHNLPMVCFWVNCPELRRAHCTSEFQFNYRIESMRKLHAKLQDYNIPFVTINAEKSADVIPAIVDFLLKHGVSHLFANIEYEVDELRQVTKLLDTLVDEGIDFTPCHNSCVVKPGELKTKSTGNYYAVFTPWYRAWTAYVEDNYLVKDNFEYSSPKKLNNSISELMEAGHNLPTTEVDKQRFEKYWKRIGEDDAHAALMEYINSNEIETYKRTRDMLDEDTVSNLSVHISSGVLSSRTILHEVHKSRKEATLGGATGSSEWIRQVSWRDFYKHILCNWPYVCMFKPYHLKLAGVKWEYNRDHFLSWCEGNTGFPIVDACMRCLNETGYLNNRGRLVVSSFLAKDLLIDWRYGEQYFMKKLVDGDFASNNGGWGFSASTGVDPQPYFRIFNPLTQAERFDKLSLFIKKWVPELKQLSAKAARDPYGEGYGDFARQHGYPEPIVDHKEARKRALERYSEATYKLKQED